MPNKKSIRLIIIIFLVFIVYFLSASRSILPETVLAPRWISSLESEAPLIISSSEESGKMLPFILGPRFGYVDTSGKFAVNKIKEANIYLSDKLWTEFISTPDRIEIKNIKQETVINLENVKGYPVLLDDRIFIFGNDQNELSEIGPDGSVLWTYEYGALLTCIDAASGLVLTGSLDGIIEILDSEGNRVYYFRPGGSRYEVILGCSISRNGSYLGIICGIDRQRFILLERFGNDREYKVVYHEYLDAGFRRPVHISFIDEDSRIVFEREGGIGCYSIRSRRLMTIPLEGKVAAVDDLGSGGVLFLITSRSMQRNELIGVKIPHDRLVSSDMRNNIFMRAPFRSEHIFLGRTGSMLVAGGGNLLVSFEMEEK
ncbi:MAG: WD40 repeat domain-containing protein [Treponema sp.]|nr:WD40 repeat domain-containing protein [Treponema sp.]MCL2271739.1 WD40 repeat domain-containing protein [Treponema sp.]